MTDRDDAITAKNEQEKDEPKLGRREFLTFGSAAVAALAFSGSANADSDMVPQPYKTIETSPSNDCLPNPVFPQPCQAPIGTDSNPTIMRVSEETINISNVPTISNPRRVYNGKIPGPTFSVKPGEKLRIKLINDLPPNTDQYCRSPKPEDINKPGCFNTTNLHFHGLHVSPSSLDKDGNIVSGIDGTASISSDDVLYSLEPRQNAGDPATEHEYCVWLPKYHVPGTHWYHSHIHGSTAQQVVDGMSGAIIVEEPSERENIVAKSEDILWILQEVITKAGSTVYAPRGGASSFLVNGEYQPVLSMEKGKMQRWRFVNATGTPNGFMQLKLVKCSSDPNAPLQNTPCDNSGLCPMHLIAVDGISFYGKAPKVYSTDGNGSYKFSPGNRADFLVLLNEPGTYQVIKESYKNDDGTLVNATTSTGFPGGGSKMEVLAYVRVTGGSSQDQIPAIIPGDISKYPYLRPITADEIVEKESPKFIFNAKGGSGNPSFTINDKKYHQPDLKNPNLIDPDSTKVTVDLNTAEEWILDNTSGAPHPFHIHINPFQVVARCKKDATGKCIKDSSGNITWEEIPESDRIWQDTVAVETNQPLKIWHRFETFPGKFVFHCHILIHEDQGMMYDVEIKDPQGTGVGPCVSV